MKKLSFLFLSFYLALTNLSAQDIVFTFNAKDASNTIDSIRATKVETGETAFAEGSNTINMSSFTTETKLIPSNPEEINVYPNPFEDYTQLKFHSNQNDIIKVSLVNSAGQVVAEKRQNITSGIHQFNISTNNNGLYILNITGNKTKFSQKIISTMNSQSLNEIKYNGYSSMSPKEKSAKIEGGEIIHFFVYSDDNITKIVDSSAVSKSYEVEFYECKDTDGKIYPIVQIGDQWWMAENLAYLPQVSPPTGESDTNPYYYVYDYNGTSASEAKATDDYKSYGVLYNWPAALAACPTGWHLPSDAEWTALTTFLGGESVAGGKLKEAGTAHWYSPNTGATNESGFSALPGGYRDYDGNFDTIGYDGGWWSATEPYSDVAWTRFLPYHLSKVYLYYYLKDAGISVRCVRD